MAWDSIGWIAAVAIAYIVGSIPSAYVAGRLLMGRDIREEGDQNPGAENAFRSIGPKAGIAVGVVDLGKGVVAIFIAKVLTGSMGAEMAAGAAAVMGHNWPIFLQLRGGRGAATTVGVFIAFVPIPAIPMSLTALALLPLIKSTTLALGLIMIPLPFLVLLTEKSYTVVAFSVGLPVMVGLRHYLTARKLQHQEEDQAGGRALPQG